LLIGYIAVEIAAYKIYQERWILDILQNDSGFSGQVWGKLYDLRSEVFDGTRMRFKVIIGS
jgi:hypothetical protein